MCLNKNIFNIQNFSRCALVLTSFALQTAFGADTVIHPVPKKPIYISESIYHKLKTEVPEPPRLGSKFQRLDEEALLKAQSSRTSSQCKIAESVVQVSLNSFYGTPAGILTEKEVSKLTALFEQIRNDGDFFIQKMKIDFPRKRPFLYIAEINPCVPKEVTGAYPSGHATLAKLYELILSDIFPERADRFKERAQEIAQSRVLSGMHHPSDIESGKVLGSKLYEQFKHSSKFKIALKEATRALD